MNAAPQKELFNHWLSVVDVPQQNAEISIRIVDAEESAQLNLAYRGKQGPTNVLSFPMQVTLEDDYVLLGDLVICAPVMQSEAQAADCSEESHWAHLTIHGMLHLLGYDHETDEHANKMEAIEIDLLGQLGFSNPYSQVST